MVLLLLFHFIVLIVCARIYVHMPMEASEPLQLEFQAAVSRLK